MIKQSRAGRALAAGYQLARQICWRLQQQVTTRSDTGDSSDIQGTFDRLTAFSLTGHRSSRSDCSTGSTDPRLMTDGGTASRWSFSGVTRLLLAGIGLVLVCLTMVILFRPAWLPLDQIPVSRLSDSIRNNLLQALGVTALAGGILIYLGRHVIGIGRSSTANRDRNPLPYPPESIRTSPADQVGTVFDEHLAAIESTSRDNRIDHIKRNLRERAIELQTVYEGYDEQTASERVDTGQWTGDPRAAAFLGGSDVAGPSWHIELWDWLRPMPRVERRIRHTVDALEAYATEHTQSMTTEGGE
ncbi:DUF7269 family protein (plasmid) [Halorientalis pallida]|uniref:DUF7269 family protein n=1 Tax=Halorientalis pallida TaxID=2479928 RepID=UPI003C6FCEDA